ncbi:hypothetical protein AAC387_Pa03g1198 [Persea americana]
MVKTVTEASKEDSDLGLCLEILQTTDGPDSLLLSVSLIVTRDQKRKEETQFGWVPSSAGRRPSHKIDSLYSTNSVSFISRNLHLSVMNTALYQYIQECMYASPHMGDPMSSITMHNLQKERYMGQQVFPRRQDSMDNRKWMLGLQFQGTPKEIMTEVLRAFQRMNVCWKFFGPFSVRCRWLPISPTQMNGTSSDEPAALANYGASSSSDNALKFEMQLYRGLDSGYQVDLLRITGPPFLFLEICAALMSQFCVV